MYFQYTLDPDWMKDYILQQHIGTGYVSTTPNLGIAVLDVALSKFKNDADVLHEMAEYSIDIDHSLIRLLTLKKIMLGVYHYQLSHPYLPLYGFEPPR